MTAFIKTAESLPNIKILMSTTAGQLLIKDGRVCGLTATNSKNETIEIHSKTVVVATGGFNSNLDMVLEHDRVQKVKGNGGLRVRRERHRAQDDPRARVVILPTWTISGSMLCHAGLPRPSGRRGWSFA